MKRIGITQRVERVASYSERRDCLDQRWAALMCQLGHIPLALPNLPREKAVELADTIDLDVLVLSGGNSIAFLEPCAADAASERDEFEAAILQEAVDRNIPVLGVCRGMQVINVFLGGKLKRIEGHVGKPHPIVGLDDRFAFPEIVNSYHTWTVEKDGLAEGLEPLALDVDGNVEAFGHAEARLFAVMWHPERQQPFDPLDIKLIKDFIG